jgi:hypothetical protein
VPRAGSKSVDIKPVRNLKEENKQGLLEVNWKMGKVASYKKKTPQKRFQNAAYRRLQKGH